MQNQKINTVLLVVVIILLGVGIWMLSKNKMVTDNQDLALNNSVETGAAVLDLNNPYAKTYVTLFTQKFAQPANYAGHFVLVDVGCGSSCFTLYALDKNTGETYKLGGESYQDWQVRGNVITLMSQGGVASTYTFNEKTQKFDSVSVLPMITGDTKNLVSFSIAPGATVSGKITANGSITGGYFFEANIGVNILDANKVILKGGNGTATSDWMTSGPVSFTTKLDFTGIPAGKGYIRLRNDNPSGMPENDRFIDIPVVFQ